MISLKITFFQLEHLISTNTLVLLIKTTRLNRSMPPRPRYHAQRRWDGQHGKEIRVLAGALARLLDEETMQGKWRGAPPRTFQRPPRGRYWRPYDSYPRREGNWPKWPPRPFSRDSRPRVLPRRGPPVASARVPRRYYHEEWVTRQPHRSNPGGPPRGGPERTANDPRRNPRGGLCGGPERSAKETRCHPERLMGRPAGKTWGK